VDLFTVVLTFLPSLAILFFVIKSDKFREPVKLIVEAFILGCLICFPAGLLNNLLIWSTDEPEFFSFLAGLTEESLKFLALLIFIRPKSEFNEPMDAVVYGTLISLGFATFENYEYVYVYFDNIPPLEIAIARALTAIPLHASCGIVMGCFLGMHVFRNSNLAIFKAILYPIFFHGTYNYLVGANLILFLVFFIFTLIYTVFLYRGIKELQEKKQKEEEQKLN
tara:strand:- start:10553 stop:11221 length:669 start_codon:yes stop_codon:yes gene_type:complete